MARVPEQSLRFESIHREVMGAVKWALGILDRGDRKAGEMIYLYSRAKSRIEPPMMLKEGIAATDEGRTDEPREEVTEVGTASANLDKRRCSYFGLLFLKGRYASYAATSGCGVIHQTACIQDILHNCTKIGRAPSNWLHRAVGSVVSSLATAWWEYR